MKLSSLSVVSIRKYCLDRSVLRLCRVAEPNVHAVIFSMAVVQPIGRKFLMKPSSVSTRPFTLSVVTDSPVT